MTTTALPQDFTQRFSAPPTAPEFGESSGENMSESSDSTSSMPPRGNEETTTTVMAKDEDESPVYTNIQEIEELNSRPIPPTPRDDALPKRDLLNGWYEYETDVGRTFFYNRETQKSQWIPPRFIRTPAQVQEFLRATRTTIDENCTFEGTSSVSSDEAKENKTMELEEKLKNDDLIEDEEVFDEVCDDVEQQQETIIKRRELSPDSDFSDDFEESEDEGNVKETQMPHPYPPQNASFSAEKDEKVSISSYFIPPDAISDKESTTPSKDIHRTPSSSTKVRRPSPPNLASVSFHNKCPPPLRNIPMPQVLPTCSSSFVEKTPERGNFESEYDMIGKCQERRGSSEGREPVRTVKCGDMEKYDKDGDNSMGTNKSKKRGWETNYMYLTTAHLILYKDQKSAEKHGKHYDAPQGVWDLRGAIVSLISDKDSKKKRQLIQLELSYSKKYLLRTANEGETMDWYKCLEDVVCKLPSPGPSGQAIIDQTSTSVSRNPSYLSGNRPLSHALIPIRSIRRRDDPMSQSAIETSTSVNALHTQGVVEESRPSKDTILDKLIRFFRTRPTVESLKEKGIYKPEPVFGSTLAAICLHECSLVPKFIRVITEVIESKGLDTDGIYRVSGNLSAVQKIRCQADQVFEFSDNYKALVAEEDIHVLTGALKLFFRELSDPLFPIVYHKEYTSAMQTPNATTRFKKFEELLSKLPNENRETLKMLLRHLNRVASHSSENRMQQHNLAIVFGPTLFHNGDGAPSIHAKNKKGAKKTKGSKKEDTQPAPIQSNSHLAFSMIMQSQIVQYLLETANRFEILKAPINTGR